MFAPAGILAVTLVFLSAGPSCDHLALANSVVSEQTSLRTYQLARLEFTGLHQLSQARVLAISGLRANTLVTQRDVEAASSRLLDSCLFSSVSHHYRMQGYGLIVTFVLEEAAWDTPVLFDNFVGYTDEQLTQAAAAQLPHFEGRAPTSTVVLGRIASALQALVRRRDPGATVTYVPVSDSPAGPRHYRFIMETPSRRTSVCAVDVRGLPGEQLAEARERSAALVGSDYSRDFIRHHAALNVLPMCHRDGRYLARVAAVSLGPAPAAACQGGVGVTIDMEPGARYAWSRLEWSGATLVTADDLGRSVGVVGGDAADIDRLNNGLAALTTKYHRLGYLAAQLVASGVVDEATRTVACRVHAVEGPRFRFRILELPGLEVDLASRIRSRWTLPAGEFYDGSYARQFVAAIRDAERDALGGRTTITIREKPDTATTTVDLILEFSRQPTLQVSRRRPRPCPAPGP